MNGFTECDLENEKSARGRSSSVGRIIASRLSGRFGYGTGRAQILKLSTSWRRRPAWVSSSPQARRVASAQARTITTDWHPTLFLPVQVSEPGRITRYQYDAEGRKTGETVIEN